MTAFPQYVHTYIAYKHCDHLLHFDWRDNLPYLEAILTAKWNILIFTSAWITFSHVGVCSFPQVRSISLRHLSVVSWSFCICFSVDTSSPRHKPKGIQSVTSCSSSSSSLAPLISPAWQAKQKFVCIKSRSMCNISSCYKCRTVWLLIFIACMVNEMVSGALIHLYKNTYYIPSWYTRVRSASSSSWRSFLPGVTYICIIVRNTWLGINTIPKKPCFSALMLKQLNTHPTRL